MAIRGQKFWIRKWLRRAWRIVVATVVLVLAGMSIWREVAVRRPARAFFDATIPARSTLAAELTAEDDTLWRLRRAPARVREAFFDAVFSRLTYEAADPLGFSCIAAEFKTHTSGQRRDQRQSYREWWSHSTYEQRLLDDGILQAALGRDPEDRYELLGEVVVEHCFKFAEPAFYKTCRALLSELARPPEATEVVGTVVDRMVEAMAAAPKIEFWRGFASDGEARIGGCGIRKLGGGAKHSDSTGSWVGFGLSGEQLVVDLSCELKALADKLPAGAAEEAAERIVDRALVALDPEPSDPEDFLTLLHALEVLGEELDDHVAEELARRIVTGMAATRKSPQVVRLSRALGNLGGQLSAGAAEEVARKIVGRILDTGDVTQLELRTRALRTLAETLSAEAAERAAGAVVEGIAAARDEHQRAFLSRSLEAFGVERHRSKRPQDLPAHSAEKS